MTIVYKKAPSIFDEFYMELAKWWIKRIPRDQRYLRLIFQGKRHIAKQYRFEHFVEQPCDKQISDDPNPESAC